MSGILGILAITLPPDLINMPELPEVEVTRMGVAPHITGAIIESVRLGKPLRWPLGCAPDSLLGRQVLEVSRRGKYLWFALGPTAQGQTGGGLLLHLGMSGSLRVLSVAEAVAKPAGAHDHFDLHTTQGCLRLHDPRRFGAVVWGDDLRSGMCAKLLHSLGVEPLSDDFSAKVLRDGFAGRRVSVKQAVLAGDVVVGVGNIYASEALFRARIHPATPAQRVALPRCERLAQAIRAILSAAVQAGGSSLKDFKNADGQAGHFQLMTAVYGREGKPCILCQTPIRRVVQGQRASYFCPRCQH